MYSKIDVENTISSNNKNPYDLMEEASYKLYNCNSKEDILKFKKYYKKNEIICTYNDVESRLDRCYIFFAVKDDIENIKRFKNPSRDDLYGTSVISIQFSKGSINNVSIKNRYNHTVNNPDATFSNNLDNIIKGLTKSFENEFGFNITNSIDKYIFELNDYVMGPDGKFYKYNVETNGIYYCSDNIVIKDASIKKYDKEKYILMDNLLLDLVKKKITNLDNYYLKDYSTEEVFSNIEDIKIMKENKTKKISIKNNNGTNLIVLNSDNQIVGVNLPNVTNIGSGFLYFSKKIKEIDIPNIVTIGNEFITYNNEIKSINFPKLISVGDKFLLNNRELINANLPSLLKIGNYFLSYNENNIKLNIINVLEIGNYFLSCSKKLKEINLPNLQIVGSKFLKGNTSITSIKFDSLISIEQGFLSNNEIINEVYLPSVKTVGVEFLSKNIKLNSISLPLAEEIGAFFLGYNEIIKDVYLPNVTSIASGFLNNNKNLINLTLNNVKTINDYFLFKNEKLEYIEMPNIEEVGNYFLYSNNLIDKNNYIKYEKKVMVIIYE